MAIPIFKSNKGPRKQKKSPKHEKYHLPNLEHLSSIDGVPLASFRSRAWALMIDMLAVFFIIVVVKIPMLSSLTPVDHTLDLKLSINTEDSFLDAIIILVYFAASFYFFKGRTLGKRIMRLRVISIKSEKISLWQAVERALGYGTSALEVGFGFWQVLWYENRQAVHDRIAETIVIKVPREKKKK